MILIPLPLAGDWYPTIRQAWRRLVAPGWLVTGLADLRARFGPHRATGPQRRALVRLLATATEERLPLADLVAAWAEDDRGWQRFRLRRLAKSLRNGAPLADALERVPGVLSDEETLAVRFATQSGTLAASLRRLADDEDESTALLEGNLRKGWNYLLVFLLAVAPLTTFMAAAIAPELSAIYDEFGLDFPATMEASNALTNFATNYWYLLLLALVGVLVVGGPGRVGRWFRRRVAPWLVWPLRRRRLAGVLGQLGQTVAAGRPVVGALATLARYHYDPAVRQKLLVARNDLDLGAELWPTLRTRGLVTAAEADALAAADPLGLHGWTLGALAEASRRRANERLTLLSSLVVPLLVLLFAGVVLFLALGMISFMDGLMRGLA